MCVLLCVFTRDCLTLTDVGSQSGASGPKPGGGSRSPGTLLCTNTVPAVLYVDNKKLRVVHSTRLRSARRAYDLIYAKVANSYFLGGLCVLSEKGSGTVGRLGLGVSRCGPASSVASRVPALARRCTAVVLQRQGTKSCRWCDCRCGPLDPPPPVSGQSATCWLLAWAYRSLCGCQAAVCGCPAFSPSSSRILR